MAAPIIYDALVVGGGPAGMAAALGLARVCRTAVVFDSGEYRNHGAKDIHNFVTRDGTPPDEFRAIALQQLDKYKEHVSFVRSTIIQVSNTDVAPDLKGFKVVDSTQTEFLSRKLLLATGVEDVLPTDIEGYKENWPAHIYQCPFCDGFERRSYPIGILTFPNPSYSHLALMLRPLNRAITIYSNGPVPTDEPTQEALKTVLVAGVKLDERPVRRLINNGDGPANGISIEFTTGLPVKLGMLYHRPPTRSRAANLIEQLGLETNPIGDVITDAMMLKTNVPGCIVAGDTQENMKQATVAAATGSRAAASVVFQLADEDGKRALAEAHL
uniref:FAD/NAD(P)-binding domain-containing protein n=1 Tax=Bionectria ochroleuca TaxID=29856 RepID=A0A8H7K811_BIOOC